MDNEEHTTERGQTLVLVVIAFVVFIGVLALVLDGGNAYAAKRQAQNAADAGALAGAQYMCQHRQDADVESQTWTYANNYAFWNGADNPAEIALSVPGATVVVTATVTKPTFFAGVIGFENVSPVA